MDTRSWVEVGAAVVVLLLPFAFIRVMSFFESGHEDEPKSRMSTKG